MMRLIEEGLIPVLLFQGENTSRLEGIKDIPKGKAIYYFDKVDIHKAKEILGNTVCFKGNVPISLLITGTSDDVKETQTILGKLFSMRATYHGKCFLPAIQYCQSVCQCTRLSIS